MAGVVTSTTLGAAPNTDAAKTDNVIIKASIKPTIRVKRLFTLKSLLSVVGLIVSIKLIAYEKLIRLSSFVKYLKNHHIATLV